MFFIGNIRIPVEEPNLTIQELHDNQEQQIVNFGGVSLVGKKALKKINYNSFYPKNYDRSYCAFKSLMDPKDFVREILNIKNNENITRVIITNLDINELYTIDGFNYQIQAGTKDIIYSISLTEYRKPQLTCVKYAFQNINYNYVKETKKIETQYYEVKENDTIVSIARKFNTTVYNIWTDNIDLIGQNPTNIKVGQKLFIKG